MTYLGSMRIVKDQPSTQVEQGRQTKKGKAAKEGAKGDTPKGRPKSPKGKGERGKGQGACVTKQSRTTWPCCRCVATEVVRTSKEGVATSISYKNRGPTRGNKNTWGAAREIERTNTK